MKHVCITVLVLTLLAIGNAYGQEPGYAIIANPELKDGQIDKSDLKSVFLGRKRQWSDGSRIVLALQADKATFETFSRQVLNKTMRQYVMYWKRMIMTGRGSMPKQFKTAEGILNFVKNTKGAVAIVPVDTDLTGVKKIEIR